MRDIRRTAVTELFRIFKMTLPAIFSILSNVTVRKNICLNFRKFARENKPLFWQKWTPDDFFPFPVTMLVSLRRAPIWHLHTKLCKFVWNIMSNNSSKEYRTDLRFGQSPYFFILYNVSISWLHSLNGFQFFFMAWQWKPAIAIAKLDKILHVQRHYKRNIIINKSTAVFYWSILL